MNTSCIVGVWFLGRRVHCVTSPGDIRRIWCAVLPLHCGSFSRCFPASEGSALALRSLLKALPWLQWQYVPGRGRGDEFTGQFVFREGARDQNAAGVPFPVKNKSAAADSASGTNIGRRGAWCQNPGKFWDGGFGATVSHLMVPELEERSGRAAGAFLFSLFHLNSIHLIHTFIYF